LMLNLRWSWHPETVELFASIDPAAWEASGGDPITMLGSLRPEKLAALAADQDFLDRLHAAAADLDAYLTGPRWFQRVQDDRGVLEAAPSAIAYFSPEYGITEVLPQYSGGLGILAGDHLKAASDLGVPLIGVGLLYRHGYFTQSLSVEGWQTERYPASDPNGLPLHLLRDAYVEENAPELREITARLYGGGTDHRLRQELLLGIGGVRAVRAYCAR